MIFLVRIIVFIFVCFMDIGDVIWHELIYKQIQLDINTMSERKEEQNKFLNVIIQAVMNRQTKQKYLMQEDQINKLGQKLKTVIDDLDISIDECKKYNQAKIHRKYQIRIADLQAEIKILKNTINAERELRSPSKKYVDDLVDKLVSFENENSELKSQLKEVNKKLEHLSNFSSINLQNSFKSKVSEKKPAECFDLKKQIEGYLERKKEQRRFSGERRSDFDIFLGKKKNTSDQFIFANLLSEIEEWSFGLIKKVQHYNPERVRSNLLASIETQVSALPKLQTPNSLKHSERIPRPILTKLPNRKRQYFSTIQPTSTHKRAQFLLK